MCICILSGCRLCGCCTVIFRHCAIRYIFINLKLCVVIILPNYLICVYILTVGCLICSFACYFSNFRSPSVKYVRILSITGLGGNISTINRCFTVFYSLSIKNCYTILINKCDCILVNSRIVCCGISNITVYIAYFRIPFLECIGILCILFSFGSSRIIEL